MGYEQSKNDYSLFVKKSGQDINLVAIYVDDVLVTGSSPSDVIVLKEKLHEAFGI